MHNFMTNKELLSDGRGVFVPLGDAQQMAEETNKLISDELLIDRLMQRVYDYSRATAWRNTGQIFRNTLGARRPLLHTFVRPWLFIQRLIKVVKNSTPENATERIHS